jgi:16S rRNA (cytosine1402-N4)-methyltransferase
VEHQPVLADEVVRLLLPAVGHGGVVVDATLGRGGHALRLLAQAPAITLVGIDRDPDALEEARSNLASHSQRVRLVSDNFANLSAVLERLGIASVRGVLLDLGVSSPQLDAPDRGFSFRERGPLDMRMDPRAGLTAADVVNTYAQPDLESVIRRYGEERFARRVARSIVGARPISDTQTLAEVVRGAIPAATRRTGGHPARRTFQALRIEVNGELDALERGLGAAIDSLDTGGRVAVLSYHSLEDRIVKRRLADDARGCKCPPDFPVCVCGAEARVRVLTRKAIRPSAEEVESNPRSSAAKLRAAEKLGVDEQPVPERQSA